METVCARASVAILAVPHTAALALVPRLLDAGVTVIDLSADYRLSDPAVYERWYGEPHTSAIAACPRRSTVCPSSTEAGFPARVSSRVRAATPRRRSWRPSPRSKRALQVARVVVDAKSGVSGAGAACRPGPTSSLSNEAVTPYKVGVHRHTPEMEQALSSVAGREISVVFSPHLVPMSRGLLSTVYLDVESRLHDRGGGRGVPCPLSTPSRSCTCTMRA